MGLFSGLLHSLGHGLLDLGGDVLRGEGHLVADGMDVVGLQGTALYNSVNDLVSGNPDGPELQLGQTSDPTRLIHGDPGAIRNTAGQLEMLAGALGQTGQALAKLESPRWEGAAAQKFRAVFASQPQAWEAAQAACAKVADVLDSWAGVVARAQSLGGEAIQVWDQGKAANAAAGQPAADPTGMLQRATSLMEQVRAWRDQEAAAFAAAINGATGTAPALPSPLSRALADADDTVRTLVNDDFDLVGGAVVAAGGTAKILRAFASIANPDTLKHPVPWLKTISGVGLLVHPVNDVHSVEGQVHSAERNPMQTVGEFATLAIPGAEGADTISAELAAMRAANLARIADWGDAVRAERAGMPKAPWEKLPGEK